MNILRAGQLPEPANSKLLRGHCRRCDCCVECIPAEALRPAVEPGSTRLTLPYVPCPTTGYGSIIILDGVLTR